MASELKTFTYKAKPELVADVMKAAEANGENVSVVIRRALIQYVKENPARIGTVSADGKWTGTIAEAEALVRNLRAPDGTVTIGEQS